MSQPPHQVSTCPVRQVERQVETSWGVGVDLIKIGGRKREKKGREKGREKKSTRLTGLI
jgi:hypothetical protein